MGVSGGKTGAAVADDWWVLPRRGISASEEVTLVTHLEPAHLDLLGKVSKAWPGPISAAMLVDSVTDEAATLAKRFAAEPRIHITLAQRRSARGDGFYPVNALRNVALGAVRTRYCLLNDIELVPSPSTYNSLVRLRESLDWGDKIAVVLPAFVWQDHAKLQEREARAEKDPENELGQLAAWVPQTKTELVELVNGGHLEGLHQSPTMPYWHAVGQHSTLYKRWLVGKQPYEVPYNLGYSPSVMMRLPMAVPFDETFVAVSVPGALGNAAAAAHDHAGGGVYRARILEQGITLDVASHRYELAAAGYGFVVHPGAFLVYVPASAAVPKVPLDASFEAGWACWRMLVDRVAVQYDYQAKEPCWVSKEIWPLVNKARKDKCASLL
eukprot:g3299.t1